MTASDPTPTRDRILDAGAELFRRQGYAATGIKQVLDLAHAPFGSLYHHFPQGKQQLAEEVLRGGGAFFLALYEQIADAAAPDVMSGIRIFFNGAGESLMVSEYAEASPVGAVAGEVAGTHDQLRLVCAEVFESWRAGMQLRLQEAGILEEAARPLTLAVISLLEGAFLLSRTQRSTEPMRAAGEAAAALLGAALPPART